MDIEPRFDVYREFAEPSRVMVVATGVIGGKMKTVGVSVRADDPFFSEDEDVLRSKVEPMIREWWNAE